MKFITFSSLSSTMLKIRLINRFILKEGNFHDITIFQEKKVNRTFGECTQKFLVQRKLSGHTEQYT